MGIKVRLVEGTPVTVGEKKLTPVMRAISWYERQATVRQDSVNGFGFGAAWLQPVAVLEETADGVRHIPIRDETGRAMLRLFVVALAVPLVVSLLTWLFRAKD
jgi:uncharacterized spore protein YtfJ